jgi:hypothetical protein
VIDNLGRYERRAWQDAATGPQLQAHLDSVITLYGAAPALQLRRIPREAMDPRAVESGEVYSINSTTDGATTVYDRMPPWRSPTSSCRTRT